MEMPQFIFELFEKELRTIQINLLKKVATKKGLDHAELVEDFLPKEIKLIPNTKTRIQVKKMHAPAEVPKPECRCMARVWNRGKGGQCLRTRNDTNQYCLQHIKNRKHGRIDEPPSETIFPKNTKAVYK